MLGACLDAVRASVPLVHNITNYVTVNDVANVLLACGGSPIMSDEPEDVEDITALCGGLNLNIGTLNQRSIEAMHRAGKQAAALGHPILLDPVGAGASALRTNTAVSLMQELPLTVIRGNISEIKTLALGSGTTKGVDADVADAVTEETLPQAIQFVKDFAQRSKAIIAITGAIDLRADDGLPGGQPRPPAGSRRRGRGDDGPGRGARLAPHGQGRGQRLLPHPHHRRHLQHDRRDAGQGGKL